MTQVPRHVPYQKLAAGPGAPTGSSWLMWEEQELGTLNRLTPETVLAAVGSVVSGDVYSLNLEINALDPPLFGRQPARHVITAGERAFARDSLIQDWNTQSATQLDGFRHVRDEAGFYGGLPGASHGLAAWAAKGIVARGVVVDVGRHLQALGHPQPGGSSAVIGPDLLDEVLEAQGSQVRPGDFILLRTGWLSWYRATDAETRAEIARGAHGENLVAPGLLASTATAEWLWDHQVCAVAADNPSLEAWPLKTGSEEEHSLHVHLLARLGIPIGELFDLDELAHASAAEGRWSALVVSSPLALEGACAGPANAIAIR